MQSNAALCAREKKTICIHWGQFFLDGVHSETPNFCRWCRSRTVNMTMLFRACENDPFHTPQNIGGQTRTGFHFFCWDLQIFHFPFPSFSVASRINEGAGVRALRLWLSVELFFSRLLDLNRVNHWPGLTTCVYPIRSIDLELIIFRRQWWVLNLWRQTWFLKIETRQLKNWDLLKGNLFANIYYFWKIPLSELTQPTETS